MTAAKDPLVKFIADVDQAELACRMIESASAGKFKRPAGVTAVQAIACLQEEDRSRWFRVTRVVLEYYRECVEKAQRVQ